MGTVISRLSRPIKNWNVENRAHKVISQKKPKAAPTFPSTEKQKELVNKLHPQYEEIAKVKHEQLDNFLKNIYVTSHNSGMEEINTRSNLNRPLPKETTTQDFPYGFYEPTEVTVGKITLRKAIEFITNASKDPKKYTVEFIASEYKLDPKVVADILEYYKIYEVKNIDKSDDDIISAPMPISTTTGIRVNQFVKRKDFKLDNLVPHINIKQKQLKEE